MQSRQRPLVPVALVAIAAAVVVLDQITKWFTMQFFADKPYGSVEVLGDWVRYSYATNAGAAFGLLQQQTGLFVLAAAVVIPAIVYFYRAMADEPWFVRFSLGLLLGGTIGNLIDRVRQGYVVDFIDVGIGALRWPSFNVADSSFVVGTIVLGAYVLFWQHERPQESQAGDAAP